ncbi:MAG: outer membrane lipid asymmetry maintenance protein MlaD [Bdellovibrionota bacterium]|jgi:phospholipid/cholesterol/gamma-HCH transport system substrate-binding protein
MDQSESNKKESVEVVLPKRSFSMEFFVGLFALVSLAAAAYLSVNLGGLEIFGHGDSYLVEARFDNISGLEKGASVEAAGVKIGEVINISFEDPVAVVTMRIRHEKIRADDIVAIRTKGIIGDKYVKISRGGSDEFLEEGDEIMDTESVVDIEDLIGKIVHNFSGDNESEDATEDEATSEKL